MQHDAYNHLNFPVMIRIDLGYTGNHFMCRNFKELEFHTQDWRLPFIILESGYKPIEAPRGKHWVIFDNACQCQIAEGFKSFEEGSNLLPMLAGGDYSIFCIPIGMEVVKTTHYQEGVSDISYTVQDKKEE